MKHFSTSAYQQIRYNNSFIVTEAQGFFRLKRSFKNYLGVFYLVGLLLLLSSFNSAPTPPQGCFEIDPASCGGDLTNAILNLEIYDGKMMYTDLHGRISPDPIYAYQILVYRVPPRHIVSAGFGNSSNGPNSVHGYEINFGFWSKDSYREYTWAEMFEWKYKRPPTPEELATLTCEQIKAWFKERHTVHRSWPLPDSPPRDVGCATKVYLKYCMELTAEFHKFEGYVQFPNGTMCKIQEYAILRREYSRERNNTFKLKIVKPCSACL